MKSFWDFYENLNEIVYAADMETYELVYLNKKARNVFQVSDLDALRSHLCYKLLRYRDTPCEACTNCVLKPGEFHEWIFHSPNSNHTFAMKDSIIEKDGHRYHLSLCIDITVQEVQRRIIHEYVSNETIAYEALRASLAEQDPNLSLNALIRSLGQSVKSDRVYIFEENALHGFDNTYEWCADSVTPQKDNLQNVPYETVALWFDSFKSGRNVIIKDVEQIRLTDPLAYQTLVPQNIHSLVATPLIWNQEIIGFFGVDNLPVEYISHASILLQIVAQFIVSILKRRTLIRRLEALSYYDQLTGAKNRHAMNDFISSVCCSQSIGLIYCDVMGLKYINDTKGHLEGDALLIRTYQCLSKHFDKNSIFRIGGDEFLIMCSGLSEELLLQKIKNLKEDMPNYDMMLAIGFVWREKCNGQITQLLKEADQLMYEDKRRLYEGASNSHLIR